MGVLYRLYLVSDFTRAVELDCMSICLLNSDMHLLMPFFCDEEF
jgi:hypothetical protein